MTTTKHRARMRESRRYSTWRQIVMAERGRCEALNVPEVECWGVNCLHHLQLRSQGGPLMERDNVLRLCAAHHDWAHGNPTHAKERGLLRGRNDHDAQSIV